MESLPDLAYPPDKPVRDLPPLVEERLDGWRLHWERDPRKRTQRKSGRARFDAPNGEYPVTYVNDDPYACFVEVYGDSGEISPREAERTFSRIWSTRPLRLIPLDSGEALSALALDLQISASTNYARTRLWSLRLHTWIPEADGLRYIGRHATTHLNTCLYLDRCADALRFEARGKLKDLRDHVIRAADAWSLAPRLVDERDEGGWP